MKTDREKKIVPLNDRVLVRLSEPEKQIGKILLPDTAQKKPTTGEVLAVGEGCDIKPDDLIGRVVIFHDYSISLAPGSKTLALVREPDLMGYEKE